jgi:putative two-component system hydrogenase maturation factor HypX/HoxX
MRILLLSHAFNSLTQRLWLELEAEGHEISLEYDINDATTRSAVALFQPDLILAPFLKRAIPADVWRNTKTLIVHPGPLGDKGPSALDHAVQSERETWGVTVLEAKAEMDSGPVWAQQPFDMRAAPKSSLYRREVTEAAVTAVRMALARVTEGLWPLIPVNTGAEDVKPAMTQVMRAVDWDGMTGAKIVARIRAADGQPGLRDGIEGHDVWLHDAHPAGDAPPNTARPGDIIGQANEAILRRTRDGAVWIGHLSIRLPEGRRLKLPATRALGILGLDLPPELSVRDAPNRVSTEKRGDVAVIRFPVLNGVMSVARSHALATAIREARDAKVILLTGGPEFWCNGIDLATIEAAESPAEESLAAIEAIDDVCQALLETTGSLTMAAMAGNAGAGGVFMALAADRVVARAGTVLSPHYKNMGNLYGSEYWTYTLPRRLGPEGAARLMETRMPILAREAAKMGLVDDVAPGTPEAFEAEMIRRAEALAGSVEFDAMLEAKRATRAADEAEKPLADYRAEELARMRLNFFGFDTSYHVARLNFITAVPKSRTPLHLARHRRKARGRIAAE